MRFAFMSLLVLVIGGSGQARAQAIGIKGGVSFGNISNKGLLPSSLETRTGGALGVYLDSGTGLVSFGIEGLYAQRGATSNQSLATAETRLDYIDVPAYLKIMVPTPGVRPFAYAGPQVSFEMKCRTAAGGRCPSGSSRKTTDFAGVIGGGVRIGGNTGFTVEGRYVYGLTDLDLSTVTSSDSYKNRTFMLLIGVGR
jgi:outer membrane protein with beta-barrel domain